MNSEAEQRVKVTEYYNATHRFYDKFWHGKTLGLHYGFWIDGVSNKKEAIIKENEYLANLTEIKSGDLVLDAGCGIGGSSIWLSEKRKVKAIGLNIVDRQLNRAKQLIKKRNLEQNIDLVKGDYQQLPFKDGLFDVFWALESIEHAANVDNLIEEAFRVLKPNGRIVVAATFLGERELSKTEEEQLRESAGAIWGNFNDFRSASAVGEVMRNVGFINIQNSDKTEWIMKSSKQMANMCRWGAPVAKIVVPLSRHKISPLLIPNNQWGVYQEELFKSGAISYNILLAKRPE